MKSGLKTAVAAGVICASALAAVAWYYGFVPEEGNPVPGFPENTEDAWRWENPVTGKPVMIPDRWKQAENNVYEDAVLTLSHSSGKSLIYIAVEQLSTGMSMPEYASVMEDSTGKRLGTGPFEARDSGQGIYQADGAELFGDVVVQTRVRIWRRSQNRFWRAVTITHQDYSDFKYEADEIVDVLMSSTSVSERSANQGTSE